MTIETTANRISYTGSGTTGPFSFPYYFLADGDLTVIKTTIADGTESTLTLTTDYTVSGAGEAAGGSVTLVATLSSSYKLTIIRDPDILQPADYPANDRFPAATHEEALDRATMILQRLKDYIDRSFRLSDGDVSGISLILSNLAAGELIAVNSAGTGIESIAPADVDLATVSAFIQTLLDDANAAAARTTLGAAAIGANTFTGLQTFAAGADIASATTVDLTAATGNLVRITGTTATTGVTINNGQVVLCYPTGAWPLTYHATNMPIKGGVSYTCAAGDTVIFSKDGNGSLHVDIFKADGTALVGANTKLAGDTVQVVEATPYTTYNSSGTAIPNDDTIPQNTEGNEWIAVTITPTSATNRIRIEAEASSVTLSTAVTLSGAFFQDSTANAIAAGQWSPPSAGYQGQFRLTHEMAAGTTSATTFKLRMGPASGTMYVNGSNSARTLGGVNAIRMRATEIKV